MPNVQSLELQDIQGDVLVGLQKDYELFCFFEILRPAGFKRALRAGLAPLVTSCEFALTREGLCASRSRNSAVTRLPLAGLNVGFTAAGLALLVAELPRDLDPCFVAGAAARAGLLGDPVDVDGRPSTWRGLARESFAAADIHGPGDFPLEGLHGVLLMTGGDVATAIGLRRQVLDALEDSVRVVYQELAHVRFAARGREHFGFRDGISQPGIRGLDVPRDAAARPGQGLPGQDLLWPGEFVLGYPGGADPEPGPVASPPAAWMRNGAYMVFRRLRQYVPEFRDFVAATAHAFDTDEELIAARLVGRWRSGAPVILAPLQDDPALGADATRNNDFEFGGDPGARRCPFGAHIRKTYPRDDLNATGGPGEAGVQRHRIRRAGIPYGPDVGHDETSTRRDRGLMFVCYQSSIERQFEFIQREWANNDEFPPRDAENRGAVRSYPDGTPARPGEDPLIGQSSVDGRTRHFEELSPNYPQGSQRSVCPLDREFVEVTAAGYFFMPSISALTGVLSD